MDHWIFTNVFNYYGTNGLNWVERFAKAETKK